MSKRQKMKCYVPYGYAWPASRWQGAMQYWIFDYGHMILLYSGNMTAGQAGYRWGCTVKCRGEEFDYDGFGASMKTAFCRATTAWYNAQEAKP